MKTLEVAFCLVKKSSNPQRFWPVLFDDRMPVFWNKKRATQEAKKWGCEVKRVVVEPY